MKTKAISLALASLFLATSCTGKSKQPKTETLWEEETNVKTSALDNSEEEVENEFVFPNLSEESDTTLQERKMFDPPPIMLTYNKMEKFQIIDTTDYYIEYQLDIKATPEKPKHNFSDKQVLQVGKQVVKSFSKINFGDGLTEPKKPTAASVPMPPPTFPQVVYRNYPFGKLTGVYITPLSSGMIRYVETIPPFKWNVGNEQKKILTYNCKKATTVFRGRSYTAWFTTEIPLETGPWKFGGLPGLILEVEDSQSHFHFVCTKIEKLNKPAPIRFWEWDFKNTTRQKMNAALVEIHKYPFPYFTKVGVKMKGFTNFSYPYNPIELE